MTPTTAELLIGNFQALIQPPPPESMGDFLQGRVAVTGMIALLAAQEASVGSAVRVWENAAMRALLSDGAARYGAQFATAAEASDGDYSTPALDAANATLRKAVIALHTAAENAGDKALDHAILRFYVESGDKRRLDLPQLPAG